MIAVERFSEEFSRIAESIYRRFAPSIIIAAGDDAVPMAETKRPDGVGMIYVCRDTTCAAPTADVGAVVASLDEMNVYALDKV